MLALQPQETRLQPAAIIALEELKGTNSGQEKLRDRLGKAVQFITETSTQINDRGFDERVRYNRKRTRQSANGESEDAGEKLESDAYQKKVEAMTKRMEIGIRKIIDDQTWLEDVPATIDQVRQKIDNSSGNAALSQITITQQTGDDMDVDDAGALSRPNPEQAPTNLLNAAFSTSQTRWQSKSLTDRYSQHNDYVGWYRMVYDAKHPGENAPPMPHASTWFAEDGHVDNSALTRGSQSHAQHSRGRSRMANSGNVGQSESESDVEIAAEKIRTTCPITLLHYKDPLASTKCPHAFEKSAILEMFKHSNEFLPFTRDQIQELSQISRTSERTRKEKQIRTPSVRCPECSIVLAEKDLRPDPVLLRKVNRVLEKERRAEAAQQRHEADIMDAEEDEDDDEVQRGTQRRNIVLLGSSPTVRRPSERVIKPERTHTSTLVDVDDEE